MPVREAAPDDFVSAMRVLEGALLEVDAEDLRRALRDESAPSHVFVAERDGHVVGALHLEESHIEAVAVTRSRRGEGIGRALVDAAAESLADGTALTADFEADVRPFYESLGFAVEERDGRLWGRR